jgi:hypothetical protein
MLVLYKKLPEIFKMVYSAKTGQKVANSELPTWGAYLGPFRAQNFQPTAVSPHLDLKYEGHTFGWKNLGPDSTYLTCRLLAPKKPFSGAVATPECTITPRGSPVMNPEETVLLESDITSGAFR